MLTDIMYSTNKFQSKNLSKTVIESNDKRLLIEKHNNMDNPFLFCLDHSTSLY